MIKVRLHGAPEECRAMAVWLSQAKDLRAMSVNNPYHDRGESEYVRIYIDAEPKEAMYGRDHQAI